MRTLNKAVVSGVLAIMIVFHISGDSFAATSGYDDALRLPELTGNDCEDFVNVALSQVGYSAAENNDSVYWYWAGGVGSTNNWCSEFVAWCAKSANIADDVIPVKWSSTGFRDYFAEKNMFFTIKGGCGEYSCECSTYSASTISPEEIRTGDLLLTETDGDYSNGPDHTCIVWKIEDGVLFTIDGNAKLGNPYGSVKIRERNLKEKAGSFHGVCRPQYTTEYQVEKTYTVSDIVDHISPSDKSCTIKKNNTGILKVFFYEDTEKLVKSVDCKISAGKKRIKNIKLKKNCINDDGSMFAQIGFKAVKKGSVTVNIIIELTNGQKLTKKVIEKVK